jgi:hypothetical protein
MTSYKISTRTRVIMMIMVDNDDDFIDDCFYLKLNLESFEN